MTGFAIGGVPTVVDASLCQFETVWCAAGTPNAVFPVRVADLLAAVGYARVDEEAFTPPG